MKIYSDLLSHMLENRGYTADFVRGFHDRMSAKSDHVIKAAPDHVLQDCQRLMKTVKRRGETAIVAAWRPIPDKQR